MKLNTFILLICIPFFLIAHADEGNLWQKAAEQGLYAQPTWYRLLHHDPTNSNSISKVVTDRFFLSVQGHQDPRAEMQALLERYESLRAQGQEQQVFCQFPARFLWLSQYLSIPGYFDDQRECDRFLSWAKPDEIESMSFLLVSGYFGNPASTFGHSLLRINTENGNRLLDLTFNFGALVPEDELTAVYIYRGLTGGYLSDFSDGHFYSQDLVYSRTEYRDIWDYQLNLDDFAIRLMMTHLWEVHGNQFNYYFLTENCALKLAELLTLVSGDERYVSHSRLWYSPVEMFHRIHDADQHSHMIKAIVYHPSFQRVFFSYYNQLNREEKLAFDHWLEGDFTSIETLDTDGQSHVLSVLLSYYEYLIKSQNSEERDAELKESRRLILLKRLQLPSGTSLRFIDPPALLSPAQGTRPMRFALGAATHDQQTSSLVLRWSPFHLDKVGKNSLEGGALVIFDVDLRYEENRGGYLAQLEVIRIRNMVTSRHVAPHEAFYAWHLRAGLDGTSEDLDLYDPYLTGGVFRAYDYLGGLFMLGIDMHLTLWGEPVELEPLFGFRRSFGELNAWLQLGQRYALESDSWSPTLELSVARAFTKSFGVSSQLSYSGDIDAALVLDYFW